MKIALLNNLGLNKVSNNVEINLVIVLLQIFQIINYRYFQIFVNILKKYVKCFDRRVSITKYVFYRTSQM